MTTTVPSKLDVSAESDVEERLYQSIYDAIVERRLLPGVKLPEQQLSDLFHTTRSRVRTVLARLAQERYLELKPNRGAYVAQPTPQEAREVFAARCVLEVHVVRELTGTLRPAQLEQLRVHLDREAEALRHRNHREGVRLSGEFHLRLAQLAGNSVVRDLLEGLIVRSSLIIALYGGPTLHACAEDEHATLLDYLCGQEPDQTAAYLREHFAHILNSLDLNGQNGRQTDLRRALRL